MVDRLERSFRRAMTSISSSSSKRATNDTRRNAAVDYITKGLETGARRPVIDRTFTFSEMVEAHRYLEQNGQFGKIVVIV
jgi:NADPH:quinone reductase-like Zn-dependent oxidoreductase